MMISKEHIDAVLPDMLKPEEKFPFLRGKDILLEVAEEYKSFKTSDSELSGKKVQKILKEPEKIADALLSLRDSGETSFDGDEKTIQAVFEEYKKAVSKKVAYILVTNTD